MNIPPRIIRSGDADAANLFVGIGKKILGDLRRDLNFQSLQVGKSTPFYLPGGVKIDCEINHGISKIRIFVPSGLVGISGKKECLCNCNFTTGIVTEITGTLDDANLYSVLTCNNKTYYVLYKNVLASDFTIYEPGDQIILIPYNASEYSCCTGKNTATGCQPIKSEFDIESDDWRSIYRIIPWCAVGLPKWVKV